MKKNNLIFLFQLIGSVYLIQTSQYEKFILILVLQGIFIFWEYELIKDDKYLIEKNLIIYVLLFVVLPTKNIHDSYLFLCFFCLILASYFVVSSIILFFITILRKKRVDIFYLIAASIYLILIPLVIFIDFLREWVYHKEFYYFLYYMYSYLWIFLLKKNIEERNSYIDRIKARKFNIYLLIFNFYNFFWLILIIFVDGMHEEYVDLIIYICLFINLFISICQNYNYIKNNKRVKLCLIALTSLMIIGLLIEKKYNILMKNKIIENIDIIIKLFIVEVPFIISLCNYESNNIEKANKEIIEIKDGSKNEKK